MSISRKTCVAFALALSLGVASAEATPISGGLSITGNFKPVNATTGALATLATATGIDFGAILSPGVAGLFNVTSGSGDFSFLTGGSGLIKDFAFAGTGSTNFPVPTAGSPIVSFQSFSSSPAVTFTLTSISVILQNSSFLLLTGQGIFNMAGFTPTAGTFDFSGNGSQGTFAFSASNGAIPQVPEPASMALLGVGLLVAASLNRWRRPRQTH